MHIIIFYLFRFALSIRFVLISPVNNPEMLLALKHYDRMSKYTIIHRSKIPYTKLYSAVPMDQKLSDRFHELYFSGHKICFSNNKITTCGFYKSNEDTQWEFIENGNDRIMLRNKNKCMHVHGNNIYMNKCNPTMSDQLFYIQEARDPLNTIQYNESILEERLRKRIEKIKQENFKKMSMLPPPIQFLFD